MINSIIGSIIQFYVSKKVTNMNIKQILDIGVLICVFAGAIIFAIYMLIEKLRNHSLYIRYLVYMTNYYSTKYPESKPSLQDKRTEFTEKELIQLGFNEYEVKNFKATKNIV